MKVSNRIRNAFSELAPGIPSRVISKIWEAEGFHHQDFEIVNGAQRLSLWNAYESSGDWNDQDQSAALLRIYEVLLSDYVPSEGKREWLIGVLSRDGWQLDDYQRIIPIDKQSSFKMTLPHLSDLCDPSGIEEVLSRMALLDGHDPGGVVGTSKELMEATAKTILIELDIDVNPKDSFPKLIPRVQEALSLSASKVENTWDQSDPIKQILGGLSQIAMGINDIRNARGSGHGHPVASNLGTRHANLAKNVSMTWCELVLETYFDEAAPWRASNKKSSDIASLKHSQVSDLASINE